MTIRLSTGIRQAMVDSTGLKGALNNGIIEIYSGAQPASADAAPTGTLLVRVTKDSGAFTPGSATNGLVYTAAAGVLSKSADNWSYVGIASGVAGYARFKGNAADAGSVSTTAIRVDMAIGSAGVEFRMSNLNIEVGSPGTVSAFSLTMPAA
jgi:hypothetical protein